MRRVKKGNDLIFAVHSPLSEFLLSICRRRERLRVETFILPRFFASSTFIFVWEDKSDASIPSGVGSRCCIYTIAITVVGQRLLSNFVIASKPPAEAPMATTYCLQNHELKLRSIYRVIALFLTHSLLPFTYSRNLSTEIKVNAEETLRTFM